MGSTPFECGAGDDISVRTLCDDLRPRADIS